MAIFSYQATTKDGGIISGTVEESSERAAIDRIQEMGHFPLKVKQASESESFFQRFSAYFEGGIKEKDVMSFTYQLGVLLEAGFPLDRSLSILSGLTEKKKVKDMILDLISHVRGGKSFSDALARFPAAFPLFYVNMVKAGEAGGFLEATVKRLSDYLENSQAIIEEVRSALIYPALLSAMAGTAVIVLLTLVVPRFTEMFTGMGEGLPLPAQILLTLSETLLNYWWLMLLLVGALVIGIRRFLSTEKGRVIWDEEKFRLPLFGKLFREVAVARFSRTLGTLLSSGVSILVALQIVQGTLGSEKIAAAINAVKESARKGKGLSEPLKNSAIFPPIAVHMITVGEETGKLDTMFIKIADRFDIEVRTTIKRMLSLLEPALILVMAIIVGAIVITMLLTIMSVNELPL
ncbi:MAG: type II secretion system F family protein [Nitrospira sp.]|nr:type II secretion system F family protein [bacterium]MBL7049524.1 type II secretion system F family protein [Nitrospira sp.]